MNLTGTTHSLDFTTSAADQIDWAVSYAVIDKTSGTSMTPASADGAVTSATTTEIVPAPASATVYHTVTGLTLTNTGGGSNTVTVRKTVGANHRTLISLALQPGYSLQYEDGYGWKVLTNAAAIVTSAGGGGGGGGGGVAISAGTASVSDGTVLFSNGGGVTFGLSGSTVTATVATDYVNTSASSLLQHTSATSAITALAFPSAQTTKFAGTGTTFKGAGISGSLTLDSIGLAVSLSGSTHSHSTAPAALAAGTQTGTSGTMVFANSNGLTFGMSGSSQITASHNGLTTQTVQTQASGNLAGTGYTSTTQAGSTAGATLNTAGLNMAWPPFITTFAAQTVQTQASGNIAGAGFTSTTQAGTAVSGTHNSAGLNMAFPVMLTTARASTDAVGLATAQSNVTWTVNSAGLSLDARGYAGTGTTFGGTNVSASATLNSAGLVLSLSAPAGGGGGGGIAAAAGTQTATSGTVVFANSNNFTFGMSGSSQITASFSESTHSHSTAPGAIAAGTQTGTSGTVVFANSNNFTFGMSGSSQITASFSESTHAHSLTVFATSNTTQGSQGTINVNSLIFNGAGVASVGVSNGSVIISVPAGGGAGDGFNAAQFTNSTANSTQNIVWAGNSAGSGNITLGLTGSTVTGSAPAGGGGGATLSFYPPVPLPVAATSMVSGTSGATGGSFQTTAAMYVSPMQLAAALSFGEVELAMSYGAFSAGTGSATIGNQLGIYTLNGGSALSLVSSFEMNAFLSVNSVTAVSGQFWWGTNSNANSTSIGGNVSASFTGPRQIKLYDSTGSLSAGNYWVAQCMTMRSSSVNVAVSFATGLFLSESNSQVAINYFGNNTTSPTQRFIGSVTTTQNNANSLAFVMPTSIHTSAITNTGGTSQHRYVVPRLYV